MEEQEPQARIQVGPGFEGEYPGSSALATDCILNVMFLEGQLAAFGDLLVHEHGIPSRAAFNVLTILDGAGQPLAPSTIAGRMVVSRPTITGILHSLERRGLVRRLPHPEDQRMVLIEITSEGQASVAKLLPDLHRTEKQWMDCLTEAEQQTLLRMLARLQSNAPGRESAQVIEADESEC